MHPYHEKIIAELQASKGHWRAISTLSGVPYSTLCKIAQGWLTNPQIASLERLERGIDEFRALKKQIAAEAKQKLRGLSRTGTPASTRARKTPPAPAIPA